MKKILLPFFILSLSACASITAGTTQSVSVITTPVSGADCKLSNEKGSWSVVNTPNSTTITKAYSPLNVTCEKGNYSGATSVESGTKAIAFGNVIAGGIIGGAVDMGTGAAYEYPAQITVPMNKDESRASSRKKIKENKDGE